MKKLLIVLFLLGLPIFGAVSTSTLTQVTANSVYYIAVDDVSGLPSAHVSFYIEYTKGDEASLNMTIEWMPDYTWAGTSYYAIGERASDETVAPVKLIFDTTDKTMFRVRVPAGMKRLYITTTYVTGSTGAFVANALKERY